MPGYSIFIVRVQKTFVFSYIKTSLPVLLLLLSHVHKKIQFFHNAKRIFTLFFLSNIKILFLFQVAYAK